MIIVPVLRCAASECVACSFAIEIRSRFYRGRHNALDLFICRQQGPSLTRSQLRIDHSHNCRLIYIKPILLLTPLCILWADGHMAVVRHCRHIRQNTRTHVYQNAACVIRCTTRARVSVCGCVGVCVVACTLHVLPSECDNWPKIDIESRCAPRITSPWRRAALYAHCICSTLFH